MKIQNTHIQNNNTHFSKTHFKKDTFNTLIISGAGVRVGGRGEEKGTEMESKVKGFEQTNHENMS